MPNAVVRLHRLAAAEYLSARDGYRNVSILAAQRFETEFKRVILRIAAAPDQGASHRGPYRWMRLRRFPYLLDYRSVAPNMVIIYAVAHGRRRLGYWLRRVRRP
jgi:plasmid stabilization system protein ParE